MRELSKWLCIGFVFASVCAANAQSAEAPPREPPYVDDNEFDPVQNEDPSATTDPIPAPAQQSETPVVESTPRPANRAARPTYPPSDTNPDYKSGSLEKGVKLLHHPDAKKGLMRIEQDGTYVYKVKKQKANQTGIVRLGLMDPPNISAADGINNFASMYGENGLPMLMGEYEWQPFAKFGKLGVQAGIGFATAQGQGFFIGGSDVRAEEKYTFYAIPVTIGGIYRLEYFTKQWLAPYVSGGLSYIGLAELRDDDKFHSSGTPGAYGAGGIMFNISSLDKNLAFELSSQYNVANLWIIGEYRYQKSFSEDLDFTGGIMTVGVGADF